jgi:SsrA-binding protein
VPNAASAPEPVLSEILTNSKARHEYHILETYEAGIVLHGTEVKSLRAGLGQIRDAFARVENGELWLHNAHIEEYSHGNLYNHAPKAPRKLLLHKRELRKLAEASAAKGCALIPLSFYWKNGKVKVAIGIGQGKMQYDKRQDTRNRDAERELKRATMHRLKGRR